MRRITIHGTPVQHTEWRRTRRAVCRHVQQGPKAGRAVPARTSHAACSSAHSVAPTTGTLRSARRRCRSAPAASAASSAATSAASAGLVALCSARAQVSCATARQGLQIGIARYHKKCHAQYITNQWWNSQLSKVAQQHAACSPTQSPPQRKAHPAAPPTLSARRSSVAASRESSAALSERHSSGLAMRSTEPSRMKSLKPASCGGKPHSYAVMQPHADRWSRGPEGGGRGGSGGGRAGEAAQLGVAGGARGAALAPRDACAPRYL
jgi:hypothetical protein